MKKEEALITTQHRQLHADIAIIGGGVGGFAAALAAAKGGCSVIMTEETDWIGGQLTSQAVPPDEHPWIEQFGCTRSYRQFRNRIRAYYKRNFPLTFEAATNDKFNPGNGMVSRLCHEPRAALAVLQEMIAPYVHSGKVRILLRHRAVSAIVDRDKVLSVSARHIDSEEMVEITANTFLDATECGDLLPLTGTEYVTGAESKAQTGEPHALDGDPNPADMQAITWCFAVDYKEGENHVIDKPAEYDFWRSYKPPFWPDRLLSWTGSKPTTLEPVTYNLFREEGPMPMWEYRRLIDKNNFVPGTFDSDISLINWPQNDYWLGSIIDVSEEEKAHHLYMAKQLSLSLLYWMQTEAPRPDGKAGYPGLRLRPDVMGTLDGLAMAPYIRESRRIKAVFTVLEQHIATEARQGNPAVSFIDSVGVGCYRIDLHPSTGQRNYIDISSLPFQIPLGSLLPVRMRNLLPACKNIGVTHITNGCYRLHPVEWNIGEAVGYLAAYCQQHDVTPHAVYEKEELLESYQTLLRNEGIPLRWPNIHAV